MDTQSTYVLQGVLPQDIHKKISSAIIEIIKFSFIYFLRLTRIKVFESLGAIMEYVHFSKYSGNIKNYLQNWQINQKLKCGVILFVI